MRPHPSIRTHLSIRNRVAGTFSGPKPVGPWTGWSTFPMLRGGPRAVDQRTYLASVAEATSARLRAACQPSRSIGPYELDHKLGEGGGSIVYAAHHHESGRRVAIKVPKGDTRGAVKRIKADFRGGRQFRHRHVVRMHHLLPVGDRYAAVMDRLGGPSLIDYVRGNLPAGELPPLDRLRRVVAQLASGLAHIHASGWIHGDVKPDNVCMTSGGTPRWLDFDLASPFVRPLWMPLPEHVAGTFAYLPPEAIVGEAIAAPADMFSFGRLLSKLICGRLPSWDPGLGSAVAAARIRQQLPRDVPRELLDLCIDLVHVSPVARPTAAEVHCQLSGQTRSLTKPHASPVPKQVAAAASLAMQRADAGKGTMLVIETSPSEPFDLQGLLSDARSEEPRLLLSGRCDRQECTPLQGFDSVLDQLAEWIEQVPLDLRTGWRQAAGEALAQVSPPLAAALEPAAEAPRPAAGGLPAASEAASEAGCEAIVRLLTAIAQERTVVLAIHNLQHLDQASQPLLVRLVQQMPSLPLVIVGTADRRAARLQYVAQLQRAASLTPQKTAAALPITLRVGC
ncbi:serine/threonine-protein kinase [Candidatus Laterigemmans baculatus]|uniref:serine/threonine-protein kinase n=1 Tax=Candidatus Laterigemmans baculatus TaxID=2770505 RepID=UPI0013DA8728|nr:serine/threonine-protein kinase [Candidatus Laterigemmans baculatus]